MTAARDRRERSRQLQQLQAAFLARDVTAERQQLAGRIGEIRQMIRDNRTGASTDEQSILAIERASLEWLCSVRLFLPGPGLDAIAPALEAEGFCFRAYDQVLTMALFPDGWSLTPVSAEPWQRSLFAYLTDPSGAVRGRVFYRDCIYERKSQITPAPPPE